MLYFGYFVPSFLIKSIYIAVVVKIKSVGHLMCDALADGCLNTLFSSSCSFPFFFFFHFSPIIIIVIVIYSKYIIYNKDTTIFMFV